MRASVFCAASLDGFLAGADDSLDWLDPYVEAHGYDEFMATVDAIVIGRRTFDVVLGFGGWFYTKPVFVLSTTLKSLSLPKGAVCELMAAEPQAVVSELERRGFQHIYVDGGVVIQGFLRAGLIDDIILTRIPILLGGGIPLFGALPARVQLKHVATRSYPSGMVQSEYAIQK